MRISSPSVFSAVRTHPEAAWTMRNVLIARGHKLPALVWRGLAGRRHLDQGNRLIVRAGCTSRLEGLAGEMIDLTGSLISKGVLWRTRPGLAQA